MRRANFLGLVSAVAFLCASLTPSLLPRPWAFQGLVSGILGATGYGVGTLASHLWRQVVPLEPSPRFKRTAWRVLALGGAIAGGTMLWLSSVWQRELHDLMGMPPPSRWGYPAGLVVSVPVGFALVGVARTTRRATRRVARPLARWVPARLATLLAAVAVMMVAVAFLDGVAGRALFAAADRGFHLADGVGGFGYRQPTTPLRSAGPGSHVAWDDLGSRGRAFVAGGPTESEIAAVTGRTATTPIRVYVGQASDEDVAARAELVVDELERTGAFDRSVLCVMTPTGMGWIDPTAADALEYLWGGDTALAGMQYSYLPSWLSHLVDATRAHEAGAALFDAVQRRWEQLPAGARPQLLTFGESLGADGSQFAFSGLSDVRNRTDGALWVGPPNFSGLWRSLTAGRDPRSPEYEPVYGGGETVRFVDERTDLTDRTGWERPRSSSSRTRAIRWCGGRPACCCIARTGSVTPRDRVCCR